MFMISKSDRNELISYKVKDTDTLGGHRTARWTRTRSVGRQDQLTLTRDTLGNTDKKGGQGHALGTCIWSRRTDTLGDTDTLRRQGHARRTLLRSETWTLSVTRTRSRHDTATVTFESRKSCKLGIFHCSNIRRFLWKIFFKDWENKRDVIFPILQKVKISWRFFN